MPRKSAKSSVAPEQLNETGLRKTPDRRNEPASVEGERRKTPRRRQIDPTTCEREYSDAEIEFMHALDDYKQSSGRMFPTCSEILEVLAGLGYRKVVTPVSEANPPVLFQSPDCGTQCGQSVCQGTCSVS